VAVGSSALVNVDWPRVGRTTFASLISDDLPFLLWARLLWRMSRRYVLRIRAAPNLSPGVARALTHPAAVAATKALLSQIVYETVSAASYLSLQGAMRGGGARAALAEVRSKLWRVWRDGFAFFSATYLLVFALPRWCAAQCKGGGAKATFLGRWGRGAEVASEGGKDYKRAAPHSTFSATH
jgi:hypothetical protein